MHAQSIVQRFVLTHLQGMHAARRGVFAEAVWAAMSGCQLSLTRLSHQLMGQGFLKYALKRMDRFIGNHRIEEESWLVAQALLARLCSLSGPVIIAVDWSAISPGGGFVTLRAALTYAGMGRALTVYEQVHPLRKLNNGKIELAFLRQLKQRVPPGTQVIVVTDAGFRRPWFKQAHALGWGWIGRLRRGVMVGQIGVRNCRWDSVQNWFAKATGQARRFYDCRLSKYFDWPCEVVLVRKRLSRAKAYGLPGHRPSAKAAKEARHSAREPWMLVHSSQLNRYSPEQIVGWYGQRMQIEESFRDTKSPTFGMGQTIGRSRCARRLQALLLIGTLAAYLLWHIGQLAEIEGLHRRFKSTTRSAREISIINLALLLCRLPTLPLTNIAIDCLHLRLQIRP